MSSSVPTAPLHRARRTLLALLLCGVALGALGALGCGASPPGQLKGRELTEAQTFPYFPVYWAGPSFAGYRITAADGLRGYNSKIGDSIYYGDCVKNKGIFGGGSCELPLQVTTLIYKLHSNSALGPQYNLLTRGVPATVFDQGRSIEIYTGRTAIDIFSDTYVHALTATRQLRPINAPGSATGALPLPVFCPGLSGIIDPALAEVMDHLPRRACQHDAAAVALQKRLKN